jgi:hypothetical protein
MLQQDHTNFNTKINTQTYPKQKQTNGEEELFSGSSEKHELCPFSLKKTLKNYVVVVVVLILLLFRKINRI